MQRAEHVLLSCALGNVEVVTNFVQKRYCATVKCREFSIFCQLWKVTKKLYLTVLYFAGLTLYLITYVTLAYTSTYNFSKKK